MNTAQLKAKCRCLRTEHEEDEEVSGELNVIPYLDVVTNIVMFLLASMTTYQLTFGNLNIYVAAAERPGPRRYPRERAERGAEPLRLRHRGRLHHRGPRRPARQSADQHHADHRDPPHHRRRARHPRRRAEVRQGHLVPRGAAARVGLPGPLEEARRVQVWTERLRGLQEGDQGHPHGQPGDLLQRARAHHGRRAQGRRAA